MAINCVGRKFENNLQTAIKESFGFFFPVGKLKAEQRLIIEKIEARRDVLGQWRSARSLKIECKSLNSPRDSVNISMFWGGYRECRRSFRCTGVLGTPAFTLKEIFKIIHPSSLFV